MLVVVLGILDDISPLFFFLFSSLIP